MHSFSKYKTLISVVIPCRNEEKYIGNCLDSLIACTLESIQLEVFVCDGMSNDATRTIVQEYCSQYPYIQLINNTERITPIALNLGIKRAKGELIAILGAHATVSRTYFLDVLKSFKNHDKADCVGGLIENEFEDDCSKAIGLAMSSPFGVGNAHFRTGRKDGFVDTVAFGIYKREVFEKIGYFDESLARNQDDEFNYRMLKSGLKIFLDLSIHSKYYVRSTWSKLFRQFYQYGFWKVFVNRKYNTITTLRQIMPFLFVTGLIVGSILTFFYPLFLIGIISMIICWLALALIFALKQSRQITDLFRMLFSFAILHIGYGLGYLIGIWYFLILYKSPSINHMKLTR